MFILQKKVAAKSKLKIVEDLTTNGLPADLTLEAMIKEFLRTYDFRTEGWRVAKISNCKKMFLTLIERKINDLAYADIFRCVKSSTAKEAYASINISSLFFMIKFMADGKGTSHHTARAIPGASDENETEIGIKPISMSLADALASIRNSKSIFGDLIENILHDLKTLPKGTPYPFDPKGDIDLKSLKKLRSAISLTFTRGRHPFVVRLIEKKRRFFIFHESDFTDAWTRKKEKK